MRAIRHLFGPSGVRRAFPSAVLDEIRRVIDDAETGHAGQIVFAVEGSLPVYEALRGDSTRRRAEEAFSRLRVWDTERNTGVLIYVLLADRAIEIVVDRGVAAVTDAGEWGAICAAMREQFRKGAYRDGAIAGVKAAGSILHRHFPLAAGQRRDELPDDPVVL